MTINEAIIEILTSSYSALSHKEIHDEIEIKKLYHFKAKDPLSIVRRQLRRHCYGIDFPSASPHKIYIIDNKAKNISTPSYKLWNGEEIQRNSPINIKEALPEEIIFNQYKKHLENTKKQLIDNILQANPAFFESLVVRLLMKMGYGWDESLSGKVLGGPGDEGIDGIINEDKLGLETIYIQAKRYSNNKVPATEIRNFIGAMALKSAKKGVFFSTSEFSEQARTHANRIPNMKVVLVDGKGLCDLLIQYEMGVTIANQYSIFEIDKNFFSE